MKGKFISVVLTLAVCLGLLLVPAAVEVPGVVAGTPATGKATLELPAEVTVMPGETFLVNVTINNNNNSSVCMSVVTSALRWNGTMLSVNDITPGPAPDAWPSYPGGAKFLGATNLSYDGMGTPADKWRNMTFIHAIVNFTAGSTKGNTTVRFCTDAGSYGTMASKILDTSWPTIDVLDWGSMQNMTVRIIAGFNLTVTSTGCCPITVGALGTVQANSTRTFMAPVGSVTLTADDSAECCVFDNWTVDGGAPTTSNPVIVTGVVNSNHTANVTCSVPQYNLTMAVTGSGTTTPSGSSTRSCAEVVPISATPGSGWHFVNWTTADMSEIANATAASTTITVDKNKTVTANFAINQYNLIISSTAGGSVTDPGEGVQGPYAHGTVVNLIAIADANYSFVNWTGDVGTIADKNSTATNITMTGNYSITANFAIKQYNLIISSTAGGSVTDPGEGVQGPYAHGTVVNLIAIADANYSFVNWTTADMSEIANATAASTTITVDKNKTVTANFVRMYTLTMAVDGNGTTVPAIGACTYQNGTRVNIIATPGSGWQFVNWTGNVGTIADVNSTTTNITMSGDYSITANFKIHLTATLCPEWNLVSTPILLDSNNSSLGQIFDAQSQSNMSLAYGWDDPYWVLLNNTSELLPLHAICVRVKSGGSATATFVQSQELSAPPSRELQQGLSLIGPAPAFEDDVFPAMPLDVALISIREVTGELTGYTMVISPGLNQPAWAYGLGGTIKDLLPYKGYWVVMENGPDTLYGFSTTPID